jgi:hypothetical protein
VYDELLRFEGNEIHFKPVPHAVGRPFLHVLLDFPDACVVGIAKADGSSHELNPPADRIIGQDEVLLLLAEDANIRQLEDKQRHYILPRSFRTSWAVECVP